jgi:peptide/nickel transport system permease protein
MAERVSNVCQGRVIPDGVVSLEAHPEEVPVVLYTLRRLLMLVPVLFGVTLLTFTIIQLTPGDPVVLMLGAQATPERITEFREQLGLNDPIYVQYGRYVWNAMHGDLGKSFRGQTPVMREILDRLPSTIELTLAAMLLAVPVGVFLGVVAATTRRKWIDSVATLAALVGLSIPNFWLAILLILVFGVSLRWVSVTGGEGMKDLILPAFTLALAPAAVLARLIRSSILEVLQADYVRTARAKGRQWRDVTLVHVLPNAMIPVVTVLGLELAAMLGGTVFVENVFARPGIGRFAVNAIVARDYPQIQGVVLFAAVVYALLNLAVDLFYGWLDPRIQFDGPAIA